MKIKSQDFLKKENNILVLTIISREGPISRADIARLTDMSPTSASRIVSSLCESNLIKEVNIMDKEVGRKGNYFMANENAIFSFGVEIDKELIRIGLMDFLGNFRIQKTYIHNNADPEEAISFITEKVEQIIQELALEKASIAGICIGLPGVIGHDTGRVEISAQLKWQNLKLGELLEKKVHLPVYVDNELKLKGLSEFVEISEPTIENMVILGFGSGVGSALITKGDIYRGKANFSGEIGHTIVDPFGAYCPCGNFGCLQTYIAEPFLLAEASKRENIASIRELVEKAESGEAWAGKILDKAITYAAVAINNTVCTFNPDVVVLAGSLIENHPFIEERIIEKYKSMIWPPAEKTFEVRITKTKNFGVVMGAAKFVQQTFIKNNDFEKGV